MLCFVFVGIRFRGNSVFFVFFREGARGQEVSIVSGSLPIAPIFFLAVVQRAISTITSQIGKTLACFDAIEFM